MIICPVDVAKCQWQYWCNCKCNAKIARVSKSLSNEWVGSRGSYRRKTHHRIPIRVSVVARRIEWYIRKPDARQEKRRDMQSSADSEWLLLVNVINLFDTWQNLKIRETLELKRKKKKKRLPIKSEGRAKTSLTFIYRRCGRRESEKKELTQNDGVQKKEKLFRTSIFNDWLRNYTQQTFQLNRRDWIARPTL